MQKWLNSFALMLLGISLSGASCQKQEIPNTVSCTPAGRLFDGGMCVEAHTGRKKDLTLEQFIDFLEPKPAHTDLKGKKVPDRFGAMCMSADDYNKIKTALDKLCTRIACTYDVKQIIEEIDKNVQTLQEQSLKKAKEEM